MKPKVERSSNYSEFFVGGTFPKISIDYRINVMDSHSGRDPEYYIPYAQDGRNGLLAMLVAQEMFEVLRPAFPYIEVIKISFSWNRNLSHTPSIVAGVVLVDPATHQKEWATARDLAWGWDREDLQEALPQGMVKKRNDETVETLAKELIVTIRAQVEKFTANHQSVVRDIQEFKSLFR